MKKIVEKVGLKKVISYSVLVLGLLLLILNNFISNNNVMACVGLVLAIGSIFFIAIDFKEHGLIKFTLCFVLLATFLTWVIHSGYFSGTEIVDNGFKRVGLFDFATYGLLTMYYFAAFVTLIFVVNGFYSILKKTNFYRSLVDKTVKLFKERYIIFVLLSIFVYAALTAFTTQTLALLILVPFTLTVTYALTNDKIISFVASFGGILVGTIGSMYSEPVTAVLVKYYSISYVDNVVAKAILFFSAYILLSLITILYAKKKNASKEEVTELIIVDKPKKNATSSVASIITFVLLFVVALLAFIPWGSALGLDWATKFHSWIDKATIFDSTVLKYILGTTTAFGTWDIFSLQALVIFASVLVAIFNKIKVDEFIDSYASGISKSGKQVAQVCLAYFVVLITIMFPVLPMIFDWMMKIFASFSITVAGIIMFISSLFGVELQYATQLSSTYLVANASTNITAGNLAVLNQAIYGLSQFFVPTSVVLMLGLSYLDIKYKEWFKFIWKFLLAMLFVIIVLIVILVFVI